MGYVNCQGIAKWQLVRELHKWLEAIKVKLGQNSNSKDLESRILSKYQKFLDMFGE
jgi:hypothetical protein